MKHTKLPWAKGLGLTLYDADKEVSGIGDGRTTEKAIGNAEFIVKAVNSHYELLDALMLVKRHYSEEITEPKFMIKVREVIKNAYTL